MHPTPRPTYEELLVGIRGLDAGQQLRLLEELAATVRRRVVGQPKHGVLELRGLGRETWQGVDAQEYVDHERAAWNG